MKEVSLGRYAGPYTEPPFKNYIQSPIGLVPKSNNKTRLIFHLSYSFSDTELSLNDCTPDEYCTVKYKDIDYAVKASLNLMKRAKVNSVVYSNTDQTAAFRILPILPEQYCWLLLKAEHPVTNVTYFFAEKNCPFRASSSCKLFQDFSDSLKHIIETITESNFQVCNYLDDYLFIETSEDKCNRLVNQFILMCERINCPLSAEKTKYASHMMIFLGIMLDGKNCILAIPQEKRDKALSMLEHILISRKITVKNIQKLAGTLNFLNRAIIPGRAFTRRMYSKLTVLEKGGTKRVLKDHHHITLDAEFLRDCRMWVTFLNHSNKIVLCRPFIDAMGDKSACKLGFYSDASGSLTKGGYGAYFNGRWFFGLWDTQFMQHCKPSIEFLELYALCLGVFTWSEYLANRRIIIFCDNSAVKDMVNSTSSKCPQCMKLIRLLVLNNLIYNRKIYVHHIRTDLNILADSLSRQNFKEFWDNAPTFTRKYPDKLTTEIWPVNKVWWWRNKAPLQCKDCSVHE